MSLARMRREPAFFFNQVLGWEPWSKQLEIAEAVRDAIHGPGPRRVAVRSGNGTGKTAIAARVMLWVLRCYRGSVVITTAPTMRQVTELLWREARGAYHGSLQPLGGRFYQGRPRWDLGPRRFALGMSPENTRPERFQGFHADLILFIVDEASGVPEAHWEAIKGSLLAGNAIVLAIGNPTRLYGEFHGAFHGSAHLWRRLHISAFDTPNLQPNPLAPLRLRSGQAFPTREGGGTAAVGVGAALCGRPAGGVRVPGLVTREGVEQARADWGQDSPLYQVRILGNFPASGSHGLIRLDWLEEAQRAPAEDGGYALGVDVARSGADETALALLQGNRLVELATWRGQDTMKTVGAVKGYADAHPGVAIAVDDGGVGGGVVDRLRELDIAVHQVKFGAAPEGRLSVHFKNKVSEMYWVLREELREGKLALPDEPKLFAQLTQVEWEQESDRAIRVHKRGREGRAPSPDRADALALAVEARLWRERGPGLWV